MIKKWLMLGSITVILGLIALGVSAYSVYQNVLNYGQTPLALSQVQELHVKRGTSAHQLVQQLADQGAIKFTWQVKWLLKLRPELAKIHSGLYEIRPRQTLNDLFNQLMAGKVKVFSITLVEGKTIKEWQQQLAQAPHLNVADDAFLAVLVAKGDDSDKPEGKFFPDTYQYTAGADAGTILTQSYNMMAKALADAWARRAPNLPLASPYEMLILASIIEKETGQPQERDKIAGVFINRLNKGMRLQTDPTVIYGIGEAFTGNITRRDLAQVTPFNTYRIAGLPPTPIAAPSGASLQAAAQPAKVNYLYFVSRNDGTHVFSSTLKAHNRAVNQYQRNKK